ncbi:response regulator [Acidisoma cellulosilytica]|uniref:Response regulator n=1 Tax=Acidisoma cellulosilyticum TaxID=2802395 RepID=A0A963Z3H2_9PROT|nr:response regulator [Acidisoma cellulosilyticum]MCB8881153.1 response regulator [Acidisoma cellulosilyticum]
MLVVEDEMLVSLLIEDALTDAGGTVVGPYDRVPDALEAVRTLPFDIAVLDVNVAGIKVYPVAETLSQRGIPFLLLSGYGAGAVPPERPSWPVCSKPFRPEQLIALLAALLDGAASPKDLNKIV